MWNLLNKNIHNTAASTCLLLQEKCIGRVIIIGTIIFLPQRKKDTSTTRQRKSGFEQERDPIASLSSLWVFFGGRVDDDEMFEEALVDKKGVRWGGIYRGQKAKEWVEGPLHILQYNPNKGKALLFIFHETLF